MRAFHRLSSLMAVLIVSGSCTGFNYGATMGIVPNTNPAKEYATGYGFYKGGVWFHRNSTAGQVANATANVRSDGFACAMSLLGLIAVGDSSISAAMKSANITKVATVEYKTTAFLSYVYHEQCTIVTGE